MWRRVAAACCGDEPSPTYFFATRPIPTLEACRCAAADSTAVSDVGRDRGGVPLSHGRARCSGHANCCALTEGLLRPPAWTGAVAGGAHQASRGGGIVRRLLRFRTDAVFTIYVAQLGNLASARYRRCCPLPGGGDRARGKVLLLGNSAGYSQAALISGVNVYLRRVVFLTAAIVRSGSTWLAAGFTTGRFYASRSTGHRRRPGTH